MSPAARLGDLDATTSAIAPPAITVLASTAERYVAPCIQARLAASSEMKRARSKASPSFGSGIAALVSLKCSGPSFPLGFSTSRIWRLIVAFMAFPPVTCDDYCSSCRAENHSTRLAQRAWCSPAVWLASEYRDSLLAQAACNDLAACIVSLPPSVGIAAALGGDPSGVLAISLTYSSLASELSVAGCEPGLEPGTRCLETSSPAPFCAK